MATAHRCRSVVGNRVSMIRTVRRPPYYLRRRLLRHHHVRILLGDYQMLGESSMERKATEPVPVGSLVRCCSVNSGGVTSERSESIYNSWQSMQAKGEEDHE